jgi:arsenate reductase-like glutaredoxin family protein
MLAHPTLIRRPVIERTGQILVGWDSERTTLLAGKGYL